MLYVGVDVHERWFVGCILKDGGAVFKRFQVRSMVDLLSELKALPEPCAVCYEASEGYGVLHDRLVGLPHVRRIAGWH